MPTNRHAAAASASAGVAAGLGAGASRRQPLKLEDRHYLWALITLELAATAYLRNHFRSVHGG
jgi:hypothetical protein